MAFFWGFCGDVFAATADFFIVDVPPWQSGRQSGPFWLKKSNIKLAVDGEKDSYIAKIRYNNG